MQVRAVGHLIPFPEPESRVHLLVVLGVLVINIANPNVTGDAVDKAITLLTEGPVFHVDDNLIVGQDELRFRI
jgi:hypothetical protein